MQFSHISLVVVAWILAIAWLFKFLDAWRGLPKIPNLLRPEFDRTPEGEPRIAAVVPACNEAPHIEACLRSLLAQDYSGLRIFAVDDRSTDSTGDIMETLAKDKSGRLHFIRIRQLPEGWLGKPHAMTTAAREAISSFHPDYLLFTDADVVFAPDAVQRSLAQAVASGADHFVLLPTTLTKTLGEALLLSYFQVMSLWPVRMWKIADPKARDAIGVGAFNMIRTDAYSHLGGFEAAPMEVLEDLMLGRRIKLARLRQRVAIAPGMVSVHWAPGMAGIVRGMTKNVFAVFRYSARSLLAATLGISVLCVGPVACLAVPGTRLASAVALASVLGLYTLSGRISKISPLYGLSLPIAALITIYAMVRSMMLTLHRGGITWRGTFYPLAELRKHNEQMRARDAAAARG